MSPIKGAKNPIKDKLKRMREARSNGNYKKSGYSSFNKKQETIIETAKKKEILNDPIFKKNLDKMDESKLDGGAGGAWTTFKTISRGAPNYYLDPVKGEARRKAAYKGTFQAAATSAAGHAGLAVLSGDDPWEAAKTGAFRGALAGGGYQTLKGATRANTGSIWGNMKHIGATTKDVYNATTVKGREQIRKEGVSGPLTKLLSMESEVAKNKSINGKKGNTTTAKVMDK